MAAYDWRNLDEIAFKFLSETNPIAAARLNNSYSELLSPTAIECNDIFIRHHDNESMILAPDPLANLREMILKTIEANLWYMSEFPKDHITQLLANCTVTAIKSASSNEPQKPIRGQTDLDNAARAAVKTATTNGELESIVYLGVSIDRWRFKPNWNASLFNKIYEDQSVIIPSSPATIPSHTKDNVLPSKDNVLPSSVRAPTPTDLPSTVCTPTAYCWASSASGECLLPANVHFPARPPLSDAHLHEYLVVCLTKRHHDALKIKLYHLHANVLSMNWFYDTFD
eukprot:jgi/Psemu1/52568/gm1.52568_g